MARQGIRARLYDADGTDRDVSLTASQAGSLGARQLLWIDLDGRDPADLDLAASAVNLDERLVAGLARESGRAALTQYPDQVHLVLEAMDVAVTSDEDDAQAIRREIDLIAGRNWVVTVHEGPVAALDRLDQLTEGDTRLGNLDAAGFLAAIVDEVLAGYLRLAEAVEQEIDQLDDRALRSKPGDDVLALIVRLRRRIGTIRRTLIPHRLAFGPLARPEMELLEELGRPWPGITDRLDRAVDAIENLRDLLLGTYDIHMGRAAQDANEVMKRLTLLSAVLLPAVVLAGVMGMNFTMSFFESASNFWLVVGAMSAFGVTLLGLARWRGWL